MNKKNIFSLLFSASALGLAGTSLVFIIKKYVSYANEYDKTCLYMAALDDEIARMELDGSVINGRKIKFPPRQETLYYKFTMFKEINKHLNPAEMKKKIELLEARYEKSKKEKEQGE